MKKKYRPLYALNPLSTYQMWVLRGFFHCTSIAYRMLNSGMCKCSVLYKKDTCWPPGTLGQQQMIEAYYSKHTYHNIIRAIKFKNSKNKWSTNTQAKLSTMK
jgi:hypothetical protein